MIANRYDFVLFFDVTDGNPNGDPDAGNLPRMDPETNQGLVSDVCLKRKVRNWIDALDEPGYQIFIREREPLNQKIAEAARENNLPDFKTPKGWDNKKAKARPTSEKETMQTWLCKKYFDIRTFGAVLSTGPNAGQVRGPVQLTFARSVEPIVPLEQAITRIADVDKEEGEMGRKHIVPYGLYRAHGFINARLAERTGFSEDDLKLFWQALCNMFELDHSAARGMMTTRCVIAFRHDSALGNAHAHELFERVRVLRCHDGECLPVGDKRTDNWPPARSFSDYRIEVDRDDLPEGVTIIEPCGSCA